jgi:NADPH-dependent 2,4-dienoyl-CoA reductase/sulfur reductase-like enzyme
MSTSNTTKEGYRYNQRTGLQTGFVTEGAIKPTFYKSARNQLNYDVIVVGAGYTGLVASRDLTNAGASSLLSSFPSSLLTAD